jgi:hypothetical protein
MTPKEKAEQLLHEYRYLFMNEGEDYGEEILVSLLSTKCALIAIDEIILSHQMSVSCEDLVVDYWREVKQEIKKL